MSAYVDSEEVANFGHEFPGMMEGDAVTSLLTAASRLFDKQCEVRDDFFAFSEDSNIRTFIGDGTAYLKIDPFIALDIDPVSVDGAYDVPDYTVIDGMLVVLDKTRPQSSLAASYPQRFAGWRDGYPVTVSAVWGFAEVPADVKVACCHLAIHLWRTADPAFATISNAEGAASREVTIPDVAQRIINSYREKYSRRALF